MAIEENGDADISVDYSLSRTERGGVFMRFTHSREQLELALEGYAGRIVTIYPLNPDNAGLIMQDSYL